MADLTLSLDDDLLERARVQALAQNTSISVVVRAYLEDFVAAQPQPSAIANFLALTGSLHAGSGAGGRNWTREQLYEQR
jgi:predicted transcriptional regulator